MLLFLFYCVSFCSSFITVACRAGWNSQTNVLKVPQRECCTFHHFSWKEMIKLKKNSHENKRML